MFKRGWMVVIGFCVCVVISLAYVKYSQIKAAIAFGASFPEHSETIETATAEQQLWQKTYSANASLVAVKSIEISNELAGRINTIRFSSGGLVEAGATLIELDSSIEMAQLAGAEARLALTKSQLTRVRELAAKNLSSAEALDNAEANYSLAMAEVKTLQARINKLRIKAPFNAIAGLYELEVGQYIDAGTIITRLIGLSNVIWLDFYLPQQLAQLAIGDNISVVDSRSPETTYSAEIIAADAWIDSTSRNRRYRARWLNAPAHMVAGTVVRVKIGIGQQESVVSIPSMAVRYNEMGTSVFVINPSEAGASQAARAEQRKISIGEERDERVIVTSGLVPGDIVATHGAFKLSDGVLVQTKARQTKTMPAAEAAKL